MAACPNKASEAWKLLVSSRGEDMAYYLWDKYKGEVPESESGESIVKAGLKSVNILQSDKAKDVFSKGEKNNWPLDKILSELQIPKEQKELILQSGKTNIDDIVTDLLANYSYAVEINTTTKASRFNEDRNHFKIGDDRYWRDGVTDIYYKNDDVISKEEFLKIRKSTIEQEPSDFYSNLTVPGGTNYTENEIATPAITPSIKGHAQFATDNGIGWFRSDDSVSKESWENSVPGREVERVESDKTKTRRILEVQSDLFQKGRDKEQLTFGKLIEGAKEINKTKYDSIIAQEELVEDEGGGRYRKITSDGVYSKFKDGYYNFVKRDNKSENQFLQLLNKDNNWVTFFVKSIIQDSAKKGYEKVLFPTGNTSVKIESNGTGINTIEEAKNRNQNNLANTGIFYETTVINTLKKQGYKPNLITDEYGNTWNEINIKEERDQSQIFFQQKNLKIPQKDANNIYFKEVYGQNLSESDVNRINKKLKTISDNIGDETWHLKLSSKGNYYIAGYKNKSVTMEDYYSPYANGMFRQISSLKQSEASEKTLNIIKEAAKKMGINIQDLLDYAKANPNVDVKDINGLADLMKGIVAIAQGMEGRALTEEVVHIATAMVEQTNPKLITEMIAKIDRFQIYKKVLDEYKNNKAYQLGDGKPNIRKIKKEAVDKLLAELIINHSEGTTEFPELMKEETRSMLQKFWDAIIDAIKGMYRKTNMDIFQDVAKKVAEGDVQGKAESNEVFYQISDDVKKQIDDYYDKVVDIDSRTILNKETATDKRHYMFDKERVATSATEKVKEEIKSKFDEPTAEQAAEYDSYAEWGRKGHEFIEDEILVNLIDENGYARETPREEKIISELDPVIQEKVKLFTRELIASYPKGTRFLIERKVVNTKVKGKIASAVDFKAVYPVEKKDGTFDIKVDNLDWKFMKLNKEREDDVPWYKQKEWKMQMGIYAEIDRTYGLKDTQMGKNRMIPFIINYEYNFPGDKKSGLRPESIEIGKLNSLEETNMYLLPVPISTESTGNAKVDALIGSLLAQYDKLWKKVVPEKDKLKKQLDLNELSKAIRQLHVQLDFNPLYNVGETFLVNSKKSLDEFKTLDFSALDPKETRAKLEELESYKESAEKFSNLDEVFLSQYDKETLTEEESKILKGLKKIRFQTELMGEEILNLQKVAIADILVKEKLVDETDKMSYLEAEAAVTNFVKTWSEASTLPVKLIKYATNLLLTSRKLTNMKLSKMINQYEKILIPLEKEAKSQGKKAFDLIGTVRNGNLSLIQKIDSKFLADIKKAREEKNLKFLVDNIDVAKYLEMAREEIKNGIEEIKSRQFSEDETVNRIKKEAAIKKLENTLDISKGTFDGWFDGRFNSLLKQNLKYEGHLSEAYKEMAKSDAALNVWKWFTALNEKAKDMGYIDKQGNSFFPLMEATTLQKLAQGENKLEQINDFFGNLYKARINDEQSLSKIDPETGQVKKTIPKYFTKTDKSLDKLSTDLNKVGVMWMKALLDYENSKDLEYTFVTMLAVEKSKGQLIMGPDNNVIFEGGIAKVDKSNNSNANIFEAIVNDNIYRLNEDVNSYGNLLISDITGKFKTDEDAKQKSVVNVKKTIKNADILTQALAVGLKPLIAFANWAGFQFQAYIDNGDMYRFKEFENNNIKVSLGRMSLLDRALIDVLVPLNEDIATHKMRNIAGKQGIAERLGSWSFNDVMMSTNAYPERRLQYANALSFNDNSMVVNGEIVNIRQYLKTKDAKEKYAKDADGNYIMSNAERRALEKTFNDRVDDLKKTSSLTNTAQIINDELVIPGVDDKALAKYSVAVTEYARSLNGQMSQENKAAYKRDTMFNSFMMFKHWIPKLVSARGASLKENIELGNWKYGRTRAFAKTLSHVGLRNIGQLRSIILGKEEGLKILDDMLENKRMEHFKKTGQVLDITNEEFYELMRSQIANQFKELGLLLGVLGLVLAASAAKPSADAGDLEKNRYKFWAKLINKTADEVSFYYNPMSAESITRGSLLPSLGLLSRTEKILINMGRLGYGEATDNEDMIKKAHPLKYTLDIIPGASQFDKEILPYLNPELAKEMGIRVTQESRRQ